MSSYLDPVGSGERREVNSDVWNALTKALDRTGAPGPFRVAASSRYAEVHYDDSDPANAFPLTPGSIHIKDITDWHGYESERVRINWAMEGIGDLDAAQTNAGDAVAWTWTSGRSWAAEVDGRPLPTTVTVQATAEILTTLTTQPSVAVAAHLPDPAATPEGERVLVRDEDQVYVLENGAWVANDEPTWVTYGEERLTIVVARAMNPQLFDGLSLNLHAEADQFALSETGLSKLKVYDFSTYPDEVSQVFTEYQVAWRAAGDSLTTPGSELQIPDAPTGDLLQLSSGERHFTLEVASIGEIELTVTYTLVRNGSPDEELTVTRRIKCFPPTARPIPTSMPPTLPGSVLVRPRIGRTRVQLALPVKMHGWEAVSAPREILSIVEPAQQLAGAVTQRLSGEKINLFQRRTNASTGTPLNNVITRRIETKKAAEKVTDDTRITVPQASQLLTAAGVIRNTLTSYTGGLVRTYKIRIAPDAETQANDLLAIQSGQVIYAPALGAALRVLRSPSSTSVVGNDATGAPITGVILEAEGLLEFEKETLIEDFDPAQAHVSGSADLILVRATFAYGNVDGTGFPNRERSFTTERIFDPRAQRPNFDQILPLEHPQSLNDAWHIRLEIASAFRGLVYEFTDTEYLPAEIVPGGSPKLSEATFRGAGRYFESPLRQHDAFDFFGYTEWVDHAAQLPEADTFRVLKQRLPMREREPILIPNSLADQEVRLVLHGHFRSRGGTTQRELKSLATANTVSADGTPVLVRDDVPLTGPDVKPPLGNGIFLIDIPTGRVWMSAAGSWVQISSGTADVPYGFGDPTGDNEPYNFAPIITGENQYLTQREYVEADAEVVFHAEDYHGTVETLILSGSVPAGMTATWQYEDENGDWVDGDVAAARRRVVLVGTPTQEADYQITIEASDGEKTTRQTFYLTTEKDDLAGPAIAGGLLRAIMPQASTISEEPAKTFSAWGISYHVESGSTNLALEVKLRDKSGIETVTLDNLDNGSYVLEGDTLKLAGLSTKTQEIKGRAFDKAGNSTPISINVHTFVRDRTAPTLSSLTVEPNDKVTHTQQTSPTSYELEAVKGSKLTAEFLFSDASGLGLIQKKSGPGGSGAQNGDRFTVDNILVPDTADQTTTLIVEATDAAGNGPTTVSVQITAVAAPSSDIEGPTVYGGTMYAGSEQRLLQLTSSQGIAEFQEQDDTLTLNLYFRDPSGIQKIDVVSGPPATPTLMPLDLAEGKYRYTLSGLPAKTGTVSLRAYDKAGNTKDFSVKFELAAAGDTSAPTIDEPSSYYEGRLSDGSYDPQEPLLATGVGSYELAFDSSRHNTLQLTLKFADIGSGVETARLAPGSHPTQWDPSTKVLRIWDIPADDTLVVSVEAEDYVGNFADFLFSLKDVYNAPVDTEAPVFSSVSAQGSDGTSRPAQKTSTGTGEILYEAEELGTLSATLYFTDDSALQSATIQPDAIGMPPYGSLAAAVSGAQVEITGIPGSTNQSFWIDVTDAGGYTTRVTLAVAPIDQNAPQITDPLDASWKTGFGSTLSIGEAYDADGMGSFRVLGLYDTATGQVSALPSWITGQTLQAYTGNTEFGWEDDPTFSKETTRRRILLSGEPTTNEAGMSLTFKAEAYDRSGNKTDHIFVIEIEGSATTDDGYAPRNLTATEYETTAGNYITDWTWMSPLAGEPALYEYQTKFGIDTEVWDPVQTTSFHQISSQEYPSTSPKPHIRVRAVYSDGTKSTWVFV